MGRSDDSCELCWHASAAGPTGMKRDRQPYIFRCDDHLKRFLALINIVRLGVDCTSKQRKSTLPWLQRHDLFGKLKLHYESSGVCHCKEGL